MAEDSGQERTEEATPQKRDQTRKDGQVAKSTEIVNVAVVAAAVGCLWASSGWLRERAMGLMREMFTFQSPVDFTKGDALHLMLTICVKGLIMALPVLFGAFVGAFLASAGQVGFVIAWKAIEPKPDKLDPVKGFGRIFSKKGVVELVKSIFKIVLIFYLAWKVVASDVETLLRMGDLTVEQVLVQTGWFSIKITFAVLLGMLFVALFDFLFQKWEFEQQIMMSLQEIKDESKQSEGDPQVKGRIRQLQMEAAKNRMMQDVPKADVVVTNPTHIAVALKYDGLTMQAPEVVAKGAGAVAERIRAVAKEHGVVIIQNKPLARNLFQYVDIGGAIPGDLFQAVAELLAQVYRMKGR